MLRREDIILKHITGKDVLDIGSVGQDLDPETRKLIDKSPESSQKYQLWSLLKTNSKSLTGIDLEAATAPGIVRGNMETYDFGKSFDVAIAGDVIEHVDNQGLFLRNIHKHLKPGGRLVITTPNAKWPTVFLKPNESHTIWHDSYTLTEILRRCGFSVEEFYYYCGNKPHYPLWKRILAWRQALCVVAKKGE